MARKLNPSGINAANIPDGKVLTVVGNVVVFGDVTANISGGVLSSSVTEVPSAIFFTNARAVAAVTPILTSANVRETSNLYYTNNRVYANVSLAFAKLTDVAGPQSNIQVRSLGVGTPASNTAGEIRATNNITAFYSDKRLKTKIKKIDKALSKLAKISGVTFIPNAKAEEFGYVDKKEQVGVIAQEVEKVLPQIVVPAPFDISQNEDGTEYSKTGENYKTVHYEKLIPLVIEAVKELHAEVKEIRRILDGKL
jgi:hypothetical protein